MSVLLTLASGTRERLATFSAGMAFGKMDIIDPAPRSAMVGGRWEVGCDLLGLEQFEELRRSAPAVKSKLLENLFFAANSPKANRELNVFD